MRTKRWWLALGVALGMGWVQEASAYVPVFVSSDSLTITITPNANYTLDLDTTNATLDLGVVSLDVDTYTVKPATVSIGSTFATTDVRVVTQISGGWTLDTNTASKETDALQAWAVFTDTSVATTATVQAQSGAFSGTVFGANNSDVLGTSVGYAGLASGITQYVLVAGDTGYKTMDAIPSYSVDQAASKAYLWLKFHLPPATTVVGAQSVTITLGAAAPVP